MAAPKKRRAELKQVFIEPASFSIFYGLPRSGNHALISWLIRNTAIRPLVFLNNCDPFRDPLRYFAACEIHDLTWRDIEEPGGAENVSGLHMLCSFEHWVPGMPATGPEVCNQFPADGAAWQAFVYRGFLNWLASTIKLRRKDWEQRHADQPFNPVKVQQAVDNYKLTMASMDSDNILGIPTIVYDRWFADEAYRESVLARLNLDVIDNSVGKLQRYGGGSSFEDGTNEASKLNTLSRWQSMTEDDQFLRFVKDASDDAAFMSKLEEHFSDDVIAIRDLVS